MGKIAAHLVGQAGTKAGLVEVEAAIRPCAALTPCGRVFLPAGADEHGWMRAVFQELCQKCRETVGGQEAYLALGAMFGFCAAPEINAKYRLFPGLWVTGQMGSGKTSFTMWLMALKGYSIPDPVGLQKLATAVGMLEQAENYSNTPLWFDEYEEPKVEENQKAVLQCGFNRQSQTKWSPDGKQRVIKTAFIVSGETSAMRAGLRSRYPHVQISAASRVVNHQEWFSEAMKSFFLFERFIMENNRPRLRVCLVGGVDGDAGESRRRAGAGVPEPPDRARVERGHGCQAGNEHQPVLAGSGELLGGGRAAGGLHPHRGRLRGASAGESGAEGLDQLPDVFEIEIRAGAHAAMAGEAARVGDFTFAPALMVMVLILAIKSFAFISTFSFQHFSFPCAIIASAPSQSALPFSLRHSFGSTYTSARMCSLLARSVAR